VPVVAVAVFTATVPELVARVAAARVARTASMAPQARRTLVVAVAAPEQVAQTLMAVQAAPV
jgi:hypothetical protein